MQTKHVAQLVVPGAALMRLLWTQSGVLAAVNILGVVNGGGIAITQALANTLGSSIKGSLTSSAFGAKIGTAISLANVGIRDIRSANQPEFLDTGAAVAGTGAGDLLPPQVSFCVTLRTALAGRSYRGRVYLWGYVESQSGATGALSASAAEVAFVTAIKSALVSSALDLGVLSRPNPTLPVPKAGWVTPVTTVVARDLVFDTQRRRALPGI
jgi:hypothetical protein